MTPTPLLALALLALASTSSLAAPPQKTITCDGAFRIERIGYCHLMDHLLLGAPRPVGLEKISQAGCEEYDPCVIRVRAVPRGEDGNQNWSVLQVYWARKK